MHQGVSARIVIRNRDRQAPSVEHFNMTVRSMRAMSVRGEALCASRTGDAAMDRAAMSNMMSLAHSATEAFSSRDIARHAAIAREIYAERRRRHKYLPADLFGEPAWDIMLDLYIAAREDRRVPTTSACIGAHVPPTTALRWLRILEARGLVEREDDGRDGRRTFVCLTHRGVAAMDSALASVAQGHDRLAQAAERVQD